MTTTLKLTISDLTLLWFEKDNGNKRLTVLLPDARIPRRGADGLPLPVHRPVFTLQTAVVDPTSGKLLQPMPWLLDGEDLLIELTFDPSNPPDPLQVENEADFKDYVPALSYALNGPNPGPNPHPANVAPNLLEPVPKRGLVSARLRQVTGDSNHGLQTGILRTTQPPLHRKPVFTPLDKTSNAGSFRAPKELFAQGVEYEVTAQTIVLRSKRFGEAQSDHRSLTLPSSTEPILAVFGNISDSYILRPRTVDRDYDWFYELLDQTPDRSLRRVPVFDQSYPAVSGGDCMAAHGGI